MQLKRKLFVSTVCCLLIMNLVAYLAFYQRSVHAQGGDFIKWVDFTIPYEAMNKALNMDIRSHTSEDAKGTPINWVELLAYQGTRYGGNWKQYKAKDLDAAAEKLQSQPIEDLTKDMKHYQYFYNAYSAVLGGYVGSFQREVPDKEQEGAVKLINTYGLKAFSPIAEGYGYSHYDDFGNSRSYGYRRKHLGNDLLGSVGTPIAAVESGTVECLGWNQYGGWRIGIRSFDGKRYYYYAHLRKDHPYAAGLEEGSMVKAGDIIGYLGMTGYSTKENVNNMTQPHLHFGIQLIFDESQKDGNGEIWIDVYNIVKLLSHNRVTVVRDDESKEYVRKYEIFDEHFAGYSD